MNLFNLFMHSDVSTRFVLAQTTIAPRATSIILSFIIIVILLPKIVYIRYEKECLL